MTTANAKHAELPPSYEGDKILRTARDIGAAIGLSERAAYNLIHRGQLKSVNRVGGRFFASRNRLLAEVTGISA